MDFNKKAKNLTKGALSTTFYASKFLGYKKYDIGTYAKVEEFSSIHNFYHSVK